MRILSVNRFSIFVFGNDVIQLYVKKIYYTKYEAKLEPKYYCLINKGTGKKGNIKIDRLVIMVEKRYK